MTQNLRFGIIAIIFLIALWLVTTGIRISTSNEELKADLRTLQLKAVGFSHLKKRWSKKGESKRLIQKLESIKSFDKRFKKGPNEVIVYEGLDAKSMDRISYAIFASDVILVSVEFKHDSEHSSLRVEMKL